MMGRKHIENIAAIIYADAPDARRADAERMANYLQATNSNFDREQFIAAAVDGKKMKWKIGR